MQEFSLEHVAEKIYFSKTKEYFEEALSSYNNGNYRSSVVMLWSVVVCDILYKLQNLVDLHDDEQAKSILTSVQDIQNRNPKSSEWEMKLIEESWKKTNLIDNIEYTNLEFLQKQRHLSAHPVLTGNAELHSPNKEIVRALLRNSLEDVLIKPPFYTNKILDEILHDISNNSSALQTEINMKRYLESRYLNKMKSETESQIFKSIWKFVFRLDNEECSKNRLINFSALRIIANRNSNINQIFVSNKEYFSHIADDPSIISLLIDFISTFDFIYDSLTDDAKIKIQHVIDTTPNGKIMGWFTKESLNQHYQEISNWISGDEAPTLETELILKLRNLSDSAEWDSLFCKLISTYYGSSWSYDSADSRFPVLSSFIEIFDRDSFTFLLQKIEENNQTLDRRRARIDHASLKEKICEKYPDFDFSIYPKFNDSI